MATEKQKDAFEKIVGNHGNTTKTMREVGYKENTLNTPKNLTESKGWKELIKKNIPDKDLAKVHKQGLKATKLVQRNNISTGKIETTKAPDYAVRHKYLETGYKITGKLDNKEGGDVTVNIMISQAIVEKNKEDE